MLRVRNPRKYFCSFSCVFQRSSTPCPNRKTPPVLRTLRSKQRRRKFSQLSIQFRWTSLIPCLHTLGSRPVFWDFPLASSFGRVLPAGFQLVRLCPALLGQAGLRCWPVEPSSCGSAGPQLSLGTHLCSVAAKRKSSPLLLLANALASQSRQRARVQLF